MGRENRRIRRPRLFFKDWQEVWQTIGALVRILIIVLSNVRNV